MIIFRKCVRCWWNSQQNSKCKKCKFVDLNNEKPIKYLPKIRSWRWTSSIWCNLSFFLLPLCKLFVYRSTISLFHEVQFRCGAYITWEPSFFIPNRTNRIGSLSDTVLFFDKITSSSNELLTVHFCVVVVVKIMAELQCVALCWF